MFAKDRFEGSGEPRRYRFDYSRLRGDTSGLWGPLSDKVAGDATGVSGDIGLIHEGNLSLLQKPFEIPEGSGMIFITADGDVIGYSKDAQAD